jgi:predicted membrane channel-forming protein YqfA (hemolysin III family)
MVFSALMHLVWVKSKETCEKYHKLDLIGILLLILGSGICLIYYQFMCMPFYRNLYIVINSLIACLVLYTMVCGGEFVSIWMLDLRWVRVEIWARIGSSSCFKRVWAIFVILSFDGFFKNCVYQMIRLVGF